MISEKIGEVQCQPAHAIRRLRVEVFKTFEEVRHLQWQWDEFINMIDGEIYLTYDWCRIWWQHYGRRRKLRICIFRSEGEIVGIIPFFIERIGISFTGLRVVKLVASDFTTTTTRFAVDPGYVEDVVEKLGKVLHSLKFDVLCFGPLSGKYDCFELLKKACVDKWSSQWQVVETKDMDQTYFEIADTWDEYVNSLCRKDRIEVRRNYRLVSKSSGGSESRVHTLAATADNYNEIFDDFVKMHRKLWKAKGHSGHFGDWPKSYDFHRKQLDAHAKHNRLCLIKIEIEGRCLGYKYGYIFGQNHCDYLGARCDSEDLANVSMGRIIYGEMIKQSIDRGACVIDSMKGTYRHKIHLGGKMLPIKSLLLFRKKPSVLFRAAFIKGWATVLDLIYYRIWFCRLAPKMRVHRGRLLSTWIRSQIFTKEIVKT